MKKQNKRAAHSRIGASSYYRWKACPGSVRLSEGIEQVESSYALEGTVAHDIAAKILEDYFWQKGKPNIPPGYSADDMVAIKKYVEIVKTKALNARANSNPEAKEVLIEHKFDLTSIYDGLYGTADAVIYDRVGNKIHVIDLKFGAGIMVEAENNLQLMYYALGALLSTGFPCNEVSLSIIQPRCDNADSIEREWTFSSLELLDFAATLAEDAAATEKEDAPLYVGDHCRFCPAKAMHCPAIKDKANQLAKIAFSTMPTTYDPQLLAQTLDTLPAIESWVKGVREFAYQESLKGRTPPGYKMVEKRATRRWKDEPHVTVDMLHLLEPSLNYFEEPSLKSPAQVEKLLPAKIKKELEALTIKESSGFKLVHESESGTPVKMDAAHYFEKIEG